MRPHAGAIITAMARLKRGQWWPYRCWSTRPCLFFEHDGDKCHGAGSDGRCAQDGVARYMNHTYDYGDFFKQAAKGELPNFVWIAPNLT